MNRRHIAIIGAGPTGLEAALAAAGAGLSFTVYEAADEVAGNIRSWGHVQLFTPWSMDVSPRARAALASVGVPPPTGDTCPTGHELVDRVLLPLATLPQIAPQVRLGTRVVEIGRRGLLKNEEIGTGARAGRPFRLLLRGEGGRERVETADVVLDCAGTYDNPNTLGAGGIHAPGERDTSPHITRRLPEIGSFPVSGGASEWGGRRILLVGAGHSAQTAACDLAELIERVPETKVVWAIRSAEPTFGAVENDTLPARAALVNRARDLALGDHTPFDARLGRSVEALADSPDGVVVTLGRADGGTEAVTVDRIVSLTGSVGDARMYRQLQVHECWATSGPMKLAAALLASSSPDCLTQESHGADTLRNPEPDFYILGSKSYGRNTTFLMRVGWDQIDEVFTLLGTPRVVVDAAT